MIALIDRIHRASLAGAADVERAGRRADRTSSPGRLRSVVTRNLPSRAILAVVSVVFDCLCVCIPVRVSGAACFVHERA